MIGFLNEEELLVKFPVCSWEYYFNEEQWKPWSDRDAEARCDSEW